MKARFLIPVLALTLTVGLSAAEPKPVIAGGPVAEKTEDLAKFKTADSLWAHIEELKEEPKVQPKSQEEVIAIVKVWFGNQQQAAKAFIKNYPKDPRAYSARLVSLQASLQLGQFIKDDPAAKIDPEQISKEIEAIIAAPEAPEEAKGEATFLKTLLPLQNLQEAKPEVFSTFFKDSEEFLAKYGTHKLAPQMRIVQLQIVERTQTPEADALLAKLAESKDAELATQAKDLLSRRQKTSDLKSKPLDLKFTATDGAEIDLAKMRGKVVLVDFWASWCGPCIAEMPNVVAAYQKLHDKGFEVVGISLDQDKSAMEAALKKHGMTWAQYFDGKGWQNQISSSYGINSIPATWLVDKKGMVREMSLRGAALEAGIEKLLAE